MSINKTLPNGTGSALEEFTESHLIEGQSGILNNLAAGAPLETSLQALTRWVENVLPGAYAALFLSDDKMMAPIAPRLPAPFKKIITPDDRDRAWSALRSVETHITEDIATDAYWKNEKDILVAYDINALWFFPLLSPKGRHAGTLAVFLSGSRSPSAEERSFIKLACNTVILALQFHQKEEECIQLSAKQKTFSLRADSAQQLTQLSLEAARAGSFHIVLADDAITYTPTFSRILTGEEKEGLNRQVFINHVHPEDRAIRERAYEEAARTGMLEYEARVIWNDGSTHWMRVLGKYFYDESGKAVTFSGIILDTTRERISRNEQQKLLSLVETSNDYMGISDTGGRMIYLNPAACQLLGIDPNRDVTTIVNTELYDPGSFAGIQQTIRQSLEEKGTWSGPVFLKHFSTGEVIPAYGDYVMIYDPETGKAIGRGATCRDLRPELAGRRALEESEHRFRAIIEQSPVAMGVLKGDDFKVETANDPLLKIWGKSPAVIGLPLLDALPEIKDQPFPELLRTVCNSGIAHYGFETPALLERNGVKDTYYFNFVYAPHREEGVITGVQVVATEVTAQVLAKKELEESEKRFRNLVQEAPVPMAIMKGKEMVVALANDAMIRVWGKGPSVIGKPLREALPELEGQPFLPILDEVYTSGITYAANESRADLMVDGRLQPYYFNYSYKPLRDSSGEIYGVLDMAIDVTDMVMARKKVEEAEAYFRRMSDTVPTMIWMTNPDGYCTYLNTQWYQYTGQTVEQSRGLGWLDAVHPDDMAEAKRVFLEANRRQEAFYFIYRLRGKNGNYRWFLDLGNPRFDAEDHYEGFTGTVLDIHDNKKAQEKLADAEERLRLAAEGTGLATWDLDLVTRNIIYSSKLNEIFGWPPDKLLTHPDMRRQVHPDDLSSILEPAFERALQTGFYEYEARLIRPGGSLRWIRTQGRIIFSDEMPLRMVGTMVDITEEKQAQMALLESEERYRTLALELEKRVEERTCDLQRANENLERSNAELAQYAFVASHDLQEPLRKIRVFSGILNDRDDLPGGARETLGKIMASSARMTDLIKDLLEFSRLLKGGATLKPTDLNGVVKKVMDDFELLIQEKSAVIELQPLPQVDAVPLQMNQLFYNLFSNALKFSKPGIPPRIRITSRRLEAEEYSDYQGPFGSVPYHRISIKDNGIGFDPKFADQIFEIFKRLHAKHSFPGSGIGLAVCRKIAENHGGHLMARSAEGEGAEFLLLLPERSAGN
jgi:hypothetical protein